MTKKLCSYATCKTIVNHNDDGTSPRCPEHPRSYKKSNTKERQRKYGHQFDAQGKHIYSSYRWKKLRAAKVAVDPLCEHCMANGIAKAVEEVDHKIEIEDGGAVWDIENLQSLCKHCHLVKTYKCKKEREQKKDDWGYIL